MLFLFYFLNYWCVCVCVCTASRLSAFIILFSSCVVFHTYIYFIIIYIILPFEVYFILAFSIIIFFYVSFIHFFNFFNVSYTLRQTLHFLYCIIAFPLFSKGRKGVLSNEKVVKTFSSYHSLLNCR